MTAISAGMSGTEFINAINGLPAISSRSVLNVESYGAVHDGVTDDTEAIQAAINAAYARGGGVVYFPVGIYIIAGALQRDIDGIDPISQLYIPNKDATDTDRCCVILQGETSPNAGQYFGIWASVPLLQVASGVILKSTLLSAVAYSSIIASKGDAGNAVANINYNQCNIYDISFQVTANASGATTHGGINFKYAALTDLRNINISCANKNVYDTIAPINTCVGIYMPSINDEVIASAINCTVSTMDAGFFIGEHSYMQNCHSVACLCGFNFGASYHMNVLNHCSSNWCKYDLYFTASTHVNIFSFQTEWADESKWFDSTATILDSSNYAHGELHYAIVEKDVGFNNSKFTKTGGANIQCFPISFTAAASFTVSGARDEPEGALASLITALAAKGIIIDSTTAS